MKRHTQDLLDELLANARQLEEKTTALLDGSATSLARRPAPGSWNALECLEHLSLTYDHYLPRLEAAIQKSKQRGWKSQPTFKAGFFGEKMVQGVRPGQNGSIGMKMKTFQKTTPDIEGLPADRVIQRFLAHHRKFMACIKSSREAHLQRPRVTSLIGPVLRFRLGDALRFLQAHNERHWLQLESAYFPSENKAFVR